MKVNAIQIRAFHAVATHGSFSRAAQGLNLSQPTLSGHIKRLESRAGIQLFLRKHRGVELTRAGRRLFEHTSRLDESERAIESLLSHEKQALSGMLKIGADAPYQLMPLVAEFRHRHPGVELQMRFSNATQLNQWMLDDEVDIIVAPNLTPRKSLYMVALAPDQLSVFVHRAHPWAGRSGIRIEEITTQTLLLREPGSATRAILDRAIRRARLRAAHSLEIGSREAVREAVAAGLGVSVIPESERGDDPRFHYITVLNAALTNREFVACRQLGLEREPVRAFFALLESEHPDPDSSSDHRPGIDRT